MTNDAQGHAVYNGGMPTRWKKYVSIAIALLIQWTGILLFFRAAWTSSELEFSIGFSSLLIGTVWLLSVFLVPQLEPNFPWRPKK